MINKVYTYCFAFLFCLALSCKQDSPSAGPGMPSEAGQAGSLSKFSIANDHLYVLSNNTSVLTFDISDANNPQQTDRLMLDTLHAVETIFNSGNNLFFGTQGGLLIYDISLAGKPRFTSKFEHLVSCDPVLANQSFAYATLRTGSSCWRGTNALEIFDIDDIHAPKLIKTVSMFNPRGLGILNGQIMVCDSNVEVFDVSDTTQVKMVQSLRIRANDIIPRKNNQVVLMGDRYIYQYSFQNNQFSFLSLISQ